MDPRLHVPHGEKKKLSSPLRGFYGDPQTPDGGLKRTFKDLQNDASFGGRSRSFLGLGMINLTAA
jgi:hypothetical protein